jgi:hypothetical protein
MKGVVENENARKRQHYCELFLLATTPGFCHHRSVSFTHAAIVAAVFVVAVVNSR